MHAYPQAYPAPPSLLSLPPLRPLRFKTNQCTPLSARTNYLQPIRTLDHCYVYPPAQCIPGQRTKTAELLRYKRLDPVICSFFQKFRSNKITKTGFTRHSFSEGRAKI